jgi:predicted permease
LSWWRRLLCRKKAEERLAKELRFHLDRHTADLIAQGYSPEGARRHARLALGGPEQVKEKCRDARGTRWLEEIAIDVRYALRTLKRRPGFTSIALLTLALGIGATTVIFTLVDGVLLKPLPYAEPERLSELLERTTWSTQSGNLWALTYPNYLDCRREVRSLDIEGFAIGTGGGIVSAPGPAEYVDGLELSAGLFSVLGVRMSQGRAFLPEEDRAGGSQVAIISYGFWQRRFGGSPAALGMKLNYGGQLRTVVGIAPAGFRLFGFEADLFTPLGQDRSPILLNREAHSMAVVARLRTGRTLAQANSELAVIGRQLEAKYPKANHGRTFFAEPLQPNAGGAQPALWILLGAVTLVLLIACVNVASLLLAHALSHNQEIGMRAALGASRARLFRQSLTESAVLGLAGGGLGILLARAGLQPFLAFWPGGLPRAGEVHIDGRVLLFAVGVSLASGILFGLAPAIRARFGSLDATLRAGSRTIAPGSRRTHGSFVVVEIALSVVLLISAGLLGRALLRLSSLDPGFNPKNALVARVALSPNTLADPARTRVAWEGILDRARHVPGIQAIAMIDTVPMRMGSNQIPYSTSASWPPDSQAPFVLANSATPDYLKAMGIPLRQGRFLTEQDGMGTEPVVVIDEVMAEQAFRGKDPIGKHIWLRIALGKPSEPATVVGVVGHVRQWGLAGDDRARVRAQLYYPFAQVPNEYVRRWSELMSIAVRTDGDPGSVLEALRRQVRGAANDQVLYQVHTMEELAGDSLALQRFLLWLFGIFASVALLLACIGIYGVLVYLTNQRVPEIGLRMALGANARQVALLVLRQSLIMIGAGVVLGVAGAIGAGRLLIRSVEGMQATEPSTFVIMIATFVAAALLASFLPARRASRIDPMRALREQ